LCCFVLRVCLYFYLLLCGLHFWLELEKIDFKLLYKEDADLQEWKRILRQKYDWKFSASWRGVQILPKLSLLSESRTVSRYTSKSNFWCPKEKYGLMFADFHETQFLNSIMCRSLVPNLIKIKRWKRKIQLEIY
jgi:hypothetical protein